MTLHEQLEYHYRAFDKSKLSPDPLEIPSQFSYPEDKEVVAFLASIFAFGSVSQINKRLTRLVSGLTGSPAEFIQNASYRQLRICAKGNAYRFYSENDVLLLLASLGETLREYGSLEHFFMKHFRPLEPDLRTPMAALSKHFLTIAESITGEASYGIRYMFPSPEKKSACKRMHLFLRWMVRYDDLDLGLWRDIPPSKLLIPVDTHIAHIARKLRLTDKKIVNWSMAEAITEKLRQFDPQDPVKYDFALCHISMRGEQFWTSLRGAG